MEKELSEIREGEDVYIQGGYYDKGKIAKVTKVTKTMITCDRSRFRRDNGRLIGGSGWMQEHLEVVTDEKRRKVEHHILASRISDFRFEKLKLEELRKIWVIIKPPTQVEPSAQSDNRN